jgi:hypothetical protein
LIAVLILISLAFEYIKGFLDTANSIATVVEFSQRGKPSLWRLAPISKRATTRHLPAALLDARRLSCRVTHRSAGRGSTSLGRSAGHQRRVLEQGFNQVDYRSQFEWRQNLAYH